MAEGKRSRTAPAPAPAPTAEDLHAAALAHLARYATTEAGLRRVLLRRVARWAERARDMEGPEAVARAAAKARSAVPEIVRKLAEAGAVNDAAFARARAQRLIRGGRSRRAVAAHLLAKGIDAGTLAAAVPEAAGTELAAALALARRRRLGPFRPPGSQADAAARMRELGMLARAGFSLETAVCALDMDAASAEALVLNLRRS